MRTATIGALLKGRARRRVEAQLSATGMELEKSRAQSERAKAVLASVQETRMKNEETIARLDKSKDSAEQTLKEIGATLAKWDKMKADFGKALDAAVRRMADAMADENAPAV